MASDSDPRLRPDWVSLLEARAEAHPDRTAYRFLTSRGREDAIWSFAELAARARALGHELEARGVAGQPVLLVLPSGLPYVGAFFGCLYARAIAVPILPPRPNRPEHRLPAVARDCGARCVVTTTRLEARVKEALPDLTTVLRIEDLPTNGAPAPSQRPTRPHPLTS